MPPVAGQISRGRLNEGAGAADAVRASLFPECRSPWRPDEWPAILVVAVDVVSNRGDQVQSLPGWCYLVNHT